MDAEQLERHLVAIADPGYTIVENAIEPARIEEPSRPEFDGLESADSVGLGQE
jgi:hypothetical protein